jgi:hypothetical protein
MAMSRDAAIGRGKREDRFAREREDRFARETADDRAI